MSHLLNPVNRQNGNHIINMGNNSTGSFQPQTTKWGKWDVSWLGPYTIYQIVTKGLHEFIPVLGTVASIGLVIWSVFQKSLVFFLISLALVAAFSFAAYQLHYCKFLQRAEQHAENLSQQIEEQHELITKQTDALKNHKKIIETQETTVKQLKNTLNEQKQNLQIQEKNLASIAQEREKLSENNKHLEKMLAETPKKVREEVNALKTTRSKIEKEIDGLKTTRSNIKNEVSELTVERKVISKQVKLLEQQNNHLVRNTSELTRVVRVASTLVLPNNNQSNKPLASTPMEIPNLNKSNSTPTINPSFVDGKV